jgi:hypothetical protein
VTRYEATINFEVNDEEADIFDLVKAALTIDLSRVELIGRTDEGEVTGEMMMASGGVVDWRPEVKACIAESAKEVARRLGVDEETANRLWEGMADVYEAMATKGLCAYPGGISPCASYPRRWSSSGAGRTPCMTTDGRGC